MATFDIKKLTTMDRVVAGAGLVALIALFLPWYGVSTSFYSASVSGFSTSYGWFGGLLIVASGGYLVLVRSGTDIAKGRMGPAVVVLGLSLIGAVIVIIRWLSLPSGSGSTINESYSYGPRFGMILVVLAGVVQVVSTFMEFRSSGEKVPWQK